jgi:poly(hydroxyalkanoate) granule-associated protein
MIREMFQDPMKNLETLRGELLVGGRKLWLAGLGLAATAGETATVVFDELVEKGNKLGVEPQKAVREAVKTVRGGARELTNRVEQTVEGQLTGVLQRFGVPSRSEVEKLIERVEALNARLATAER